MDTPITPRTAAAPEPKHERRAVTAIHRGRWTLVVPQDPRDEYEVVAARVGAGVAGFRFACPRRELVALRTAITAAVLAPKKRGTR